MQETRNNRVEKRSTTLLQAKTGKYECRKVTATYSMVLLPKVLLNRTTFIFNL